MLSVLAALRLTPLIHEINASAIHTPTIGHTLVRGWQCNVGSVATPMDRKFEELLHVAPAHLPEHLTHGIIGATVQWPM